MNVSSVNSQNTFSVTGPVSNINNSTSQQDTVEKTVPAEKESEKFSQLLPYQKDPLTKMMEDTNAFLQAINTDIRFKWHEKAHQLMVEVYDSRNDKVIKTFPPKEFLDTIAKIKEYVGALIDKKV
ncbi:flagellar protein FlaG [Heliobacterium chlorum]|uniref:Flagellar protein FlaG n=1 Tax=Heliobacterium chlorum TaxID=2698 RepID=A0ABR7T1P8_HELCL|nr:flagellar protein FlaG [Heliobacterium chlorum]MBC9784708.1 flagellar protein FlaG [Heliobacterium chlorum]